MKYYPGDYVLIRDGVGDDLIGVIKEGFCYGVGNTIYYTAGRRCHRNSEYYDVSVDFGSLFCHNDDIIRKLTKNEIAVFKLEGKL